MAAEYNLLSAPQYDKLMKLQKKLDEENNGTKNYVLPGEENNAKDIDMPQKDNKTVKINNDYSKNDISDKVDGVDNDISSQDGPAILNDTAIAPDAKDILPKRGKVKQKKENIIANNQGALSPDNIEGIVEQFNKPLKRKVKRLIIYMFKFGRDIALKDGILYYKNDIVGDVVKLIKSIFGITPTIPGVRKLRRVLFILSVPVALFTLSTAERKKLADFKGLAKSNNSSDGAASLDWLDY
jgi:hypothetical protein